VLSASCHQSLVPNATCHQCAINSQFLIKELKQISIKQTEQLQEEYEISAADDSRSPNYSEFFFCRARLRNVMNDVNL